MTNPDPRSAKAMTDALVTDGLLDRLIDVITQHRTARLREARQTYTANTSGLLARLETEYEILTLIDELFGTDLTDARDELADECRRECGYDLREAVLVRTVETLADYADHMNDCRREDRMVAAGAA